MREVLLAVAILEVPLSQTRSKEASGLSLGEWQILDRKSCESVIRLTHTNRPTHFPIHLTHMLCTLRSTYSWPVIRRKLRSNWKAPDMKGFEAAFCKRWSVHSNWEHEKSQMKCNHNCYCGNSGLYIFVKKTFKKLHFVSLCSKKGVVSSFVFQCVLPLVLQLGGRM